MRYEGERCPICDRVGLAEQPIEDREYHTPKIKRSSKSAGKFIGILVVIVLGLILVPVGIMYFGDISTSQPGRAIELGSDNSITIDGKPLETQNPELIPEPLPKQIPQPKPVSEKTPDQIPTPKTTPNQNKPTIDYLQLEQRIHELINNERSKNGLTTVSLNPILSDIARKHSQDMATRNYFEHDTPEGKTFSDRYEEGGFSCEIPIDVTTTETAEGTRTRTTYSTGSENISYVPLAESITYTGENEVISYDWNSLEDIAQSAVSGWMGSEGHRKNILTDYHKSEGIGLAVSNDDKVYITEDFC